MTSNDGALLSVRDLSVEFRSPSGPILAVDRVSFDVKPGEPPVLLSTSVFGPAGHVGYYAWSSDGQRVAFSCELVNGDASGVYTAPAVGGGDVLESSPAADARYFRFSSDASVLVWREGYDTGDHRLFGAESGGTTPLLPSTPAYTDVNAFAPR